MAKVTIAFRMITASILLGMLSMYTANALNVWLWLLFLLVFTGYILLFTRIFEFWIIVPSFISGKLWVLTVGLNQNTIGILVISISFLFFFFAEFKRKKNIPASGEEKSVDERV